jgi:NitT/TauT family transport system substrate-binding protein
MMAPSPIDGRRRALLLGAAAAALPINAFAARGPLVVGGLPVTCNLTLPVACVARAGGQFEYSKYNGWPEIKESLMAGRIQAAYMLAPLVMDLADRKIPLKIVSLGHRSGAVIMVRSDSGYTSYRQLKGKRVAVPSRFAVDFLFLRRMLAKEGMTPKDIELIEMAPPDMPAALYAKAVDAYCTGEPFGAAAQRAGYARPLSMTRDEWRRYICCVLTVREELIAENRPLVQDLVNYVLGAGVWLGLEAGQPRQGRHHRLGAQVLQPGPQHHPVRDGESDRSRDLRRPHDAPRGVRGADAAVHRGRHAQAPRRLRKIRRRELREEREARGDQPVKGFFSRLRSSRPPSMRRTAS